MHEDALPVALMESQHKDVSGSRIKTLCSCHSQELLGSASGLTDTPWCVWGLRPLPQDQTEGLQSRMQAQIVSSLPGSTSAGRPGQQVDRFDPGYSQNEKNF